MLEVGKLNLAVSAFEHSAVIILNEFFFLTKQRCLS